MVIYDFYISSLVNVLHLYIVYVVGAPIIMLHDLLWLI